jgi:protocatechuate 3,4-dioxygenase beta subunit
MQEEKMPDETRRRLLRALAIAPFALGSAMLLNTAGCASDPDDTPSLTANPTPACSDDDDDDPSPAQTEGPYFTPNSPLRSSLLEAGIIGTVLVLSGKVLTRSCAPIANALIDFWQADDRGNYDNSGFRLRGHQFTNASGEYRLQTVVPGLYPGRTRHIHVKVQAPSRPVLTTQLYFPAESRNASDGIYSPELLIAIAANGSAQDGMFNFVLDMA